MHRISRRLPSRMVSSMLAAHHCCAAMSAQPAAAGAGSSFAALLTQPPSISAAPSLLAGKRAQSSTERAVEQQGPGAATPLNPGAAAAAASQQVDPARITKSAVWGLWNEGNLFSMTLAELAAFLKSVGVEPATGAKKTAMVRQVEDHMSHEQPTPVNKDADVGGAGDAASASNVDISAETDRYSVNATDLFEEADVYGDWGAEAGFEDRKELEFLALAAKARPGVTIDVMAGPMQCHAYQLLHQELSGDIALTELDTSQLPGCKHLKRTLGVSTINADDANRLRFRKAFKWSAQGIWQSNLDGEINIGAGKALYWRRVARQNRNVQPIWACQDRLNVTHPYTWFAVAHESNTAAVEAFVSKHQMKVSQPSTLSYKAKIKRSRDVLDVELNDQLQVALVNRPWERFLVSHVLREKMPDLRYLIRARVPIKKKISDLYYEAQMLKLSSDSLVSVLSPELGDVTYACERKIRKWSTMLPCGVKMSVVETRRTPFIVTRPGEEGERIEYELIAGVPQQGENLDLYAVADALWGHGNEFAAVLEEGMQQLHAFTMPASAAFDAVYNTAAATKA